MSSFSFTVTVSVWISHIPPPLSSYAHCCLFIFPLLSLTHLYFSHSTNGRTEAAGERDLLLPPRPDHHPLFDRTNRNSLSNCLSLDPSIYHQQQPSRRERRSRPRHRHNFSQSHSSLILESFLLLLGPSPSPAPLNHLWLVLYSLFIANTLRILLLSTSHLSSFRVLKHLFIRRWMMAGDDYSIKFIF